MLAVPLATVQCRLAAFSTLSQYWAAGTEEALFLTEGVCVNKSLVIFSFYSENLHAAVVGENESVSCFVCSYFLHSLCKTVDHD